MTTQLLVPIHTSPEGAHNTERLAIHVVTLAEYLQADVSAVVNIVDFPSVSNPFARSLVNVASLIAQAKAAERARAKLVIEALRREAERTHTAIKVSEVECVAGAFGRVAAEMAHYADITVLAIGRNENDRTIQNTAEAVLFGSGRPVMLVPEALEPTVPDQVLIAWDGTVSAARAVADAREILERAKSVVVVTVTDEKPLPGSDIGQRLSSYLELGGVRAETIRIPRSGHSIGDVLQEQARNRGSSLLVMGGFGHSRMRDFVLGGATKTVLDQPQIPIFLSH